MDIENKENMKAMEVTANTEDAGAKTQEASEMEKSAPDLGKFKSVDALLQAYNSLQAEFTRRSQRLKELEGLALKKNAQVESEPVTEQTNEAASKVTPMPKINEDIPLSDAQKQRVIEEYLSDIKRSSVPLMTAGVSVTSPVTKAKNFTEAGKMALGYFRGSK